MIVALMASRGVGGYFVAPLCWVTAPVFLSPNGSEDGLLNACRGPRRPAGVLVVGCIVGLMAVIGCTRPADRPIEGARPGREAASPEAIGSFAVPVDTPAPAASPPAPPAPVASPVPSPPPTGRGPVISTIQPAANATVPPGVVTISSRVSALSDIAEVTIVVDGQAVRPTATGDPRTPTYSVTINLAAGQHQARISVRDDQGRTGGFTWTFTVADSPARPSPAPKR